MVLKEESALEHSRGLYCGDGIQITMCEKCRDPESPSMCEKMTTLHAEAVREARSQRQIAQETGNAAEDAARIARDRLHSREIVLAAVGG